MGKVILCSGKLSVRPYEVEPGRRVYSAEELCYYVYENALKISADFFGQELILWLKKNAAMDEISEKLTFLNDNGYSFKDKVVALLCSTDYYTEEEIIRLIKKMNAWESLPEWRKKKLHADELLMEQSYVRAGSEYEKTLSAAGLEDEDRAVIYHNIGVTRMHTASAGEAAEFFVKAYRMGRNRESLKSAVMAYVMNGSLDKAGELAEEEGVGREFVKECSAEHRRLVSEADKTDTIAQMSSSDIQQTIREWKKRVRKE